jgi:hypothetical protein
LKYSETEMDSMDRAMCYLESLGSAITRLSLYEDEPHDMSVMADMGRLVSEKASTLLDAIQRAPGEE